MDELDEKATTALDEAIVKFENELNSKATFEEKMAFIDQEIANLKFELGMNFSAYEKDQLEYEMNYALGKKAMMSKFMEGYYD